MSFPSHVKIVEVSPRDGLQNEKTIIPTSIKIQLIDQLTATGLSVIEATSFVSAKKIPQLADAADVFSGIHKKMNVTYPVLVPNLKGLEHALAVGVQDIAVFTTPSEQFSQRNTGHSVAENMSTIEEVITIAKQKNLRIRAYLSCVLGCPYEGIISPEKVATLAARIFNLGCDEISLGDTIGVGTPFVTTHLIEAVIKQVPVTQVAVHFHDTYGQALTNIYAALQLGVAIIDSSVAGIGGCPYAKGATGNVATEDVVYMLNGMGIKTGVDLEKLIHVGQFIAQHLGIKPLSRVNLANQRRS